MPLYYPPEVGGGELPPLSYRDIYVDPPSNPDPWNDEFDSGSPVLADRGLRLTQYQGGAGELTTRVGEVDMFAPALAVTEYRSSIRDSCLLLQLPAGVWYLNKAVPLASAAHAVRVLPRRVGTSNQYIGMSVGSAINQGQGSDRSIYVLIHTDNAQHDIGRYQTIFNGIINVTSADHGPTVFWGDFELDGSSNMRFSAETNIHGRTVLVTAAQAGPFATFWTGSLYAGALVSSPGNYMTWVEVDYIRRYPVHSYFPA